MTSTPANSTPAKQIHYLVFDVPLPPRVLHPNQRTRSIKFKSSEVKKYRQQVADIAGFKTRELRIKTPNLRAAVIKPCFLLPKGSKRSDPDNCIAWIKAAIDGLTDANILADDRDVAYLPPIQKTGNLFSALKMLVIPASPEILADWESELILELTGEKPPQTKTADKTQNLNASDRQTAIKRHNALFERIFGI